MVASNRQYIEITDSVRDDLSWWRNLCTYFNGVSKIVKDCYYLSMVSDSSKKGFAVYLGQDWAAGTWHGGDSIQLFSSCNHVVFRPVADNFDSDNIHELEFWPIVVGLKRWVSLLRDTSVFV